MQIENETIERRLFKPASWEEQTFRFCRFRNVDGQGLHVISDFIDCEFESGDFYWAHFNVVVFVGVVFKNCRFRGCAFSDCRLVECRFENCEFAQDNLGSNCTFEGSRWYGCKQSSSQGLSEKLAVL